MNKQELKKYPFIKLILFNFIKIAIAEKLITYEHSIKNINVNEDIIIELICIKGDYIEIKKIISNNAIDKYEERKNVWKLAIKECKSFLYNNYEVESPTTTELIMDIINIIIDKNNAQYDEFRENRIINLLFGQTKILLLCDISKFTVNTNERR